MDKNTKTAVKEVFKKGFQDMAKNIAETNVQRKSGSRRQQRADIYRNKYNGRFLYEDLNALSNRQVIIKCFHLDKAEGPQTMRRRK